MKIAIASKNPVKVNAAKEGFTKMFPDTAFEFETTDVDSGVPPQPMGSNETLKGAANRAKNALSAVPDAEYGVGLEGGVEEIDGRLQSFSWAVIMHKDGMIGEARSAAWFLPQAVSSLIFEGIEYGEAGDKVFNETNLKQKGGLVSLLTDSAITRTDLYAQPMTLALIPFKNLEHY